MLEKELQAQLVARPRSCLLSPPNLQQCGDARAGAWKEDFAAHDTKFFDRLITQQV